jgi:hypothetical protein
MNWEGNALLLIYVAYIHPRPNCGIITSDNSLHIKKYLLYKKDLEKYLNPKTI